MQGKLRKVKNKYVCFSSFSPHEDPPERKPECSWRKMTDPSLITFTCNWEGGYPAPTLQWEDVASKGPALNFSSSDSVEVVLNRTLLSDDQELRCQGTHVALSGEERFCHFTLSKSREVQGVVLS